MKKNTTKKKSNVTPLAPLRARKRNAKVSARVEPAAAKKPYEAPVIELVPASSDKALDYLTAVGFSESEAARLKERFPILPLDGELVAVAERFIATHESGWNHEEWLSLVRDLARQGYNVGVDAVRFGVSLQLLGTVLETLRAERRVQPLQKAA